jgi:hypothetical protein
MRGGTAHRWALRAGFGLLLAVLTVGCKSCEKQGPVGEKRPARVSAAEAAQLVPPDVKDRAGWGRDVVAVLEAHALWPDRPAVCSVLAVIEQESGFQANPPVPNLSKLVRKKLEEEAGKFGPLGPPAMRKLLEEKAEGQTQSFSERLERVRTEQDLDRVFRDMLAHYRQKFGAAYAAANMLGQLFKGQALEDLNPITTAGSMQVSVRYARELAERQGKDPEKVRDELYTRYGGIYYGASRLLGYTADYTEPSHRFADYNAGFYASRNASLQAQVAALTGLPVAPDGDLLAYDKRGEPVGKDSQTLLAFLAFRERFAPETLSERELRRDLREEKKPGLEETETWATVRRVYQEQKGKKPPYAQLPEVTISSPKMSRDRSTAWFARNVDIRYRRCMARPLTRTAAAR